MDADFTTMFLVRIETGKRPRVYKVDPYETTDSPTGYNGQRRRQPRAWVIRATSEGPVIGFAAIANTVDDAYILIHGLRQEIAEAEAASV